jgi:membrane protein implicated in regulation of membrane protease activity
MNHSQHTKSQTSFLGSKTLLICLGLIALAVGSVVFFNVSISTVFFLGFALACPLMHIWMMKDGGHKH